MFSLFNFSSIFLGGGVSWRYVRMLMSEIRYARGLLGSAAVLPPVCLSHSPASTVHFRATVIGHYRTLIGSLHAGSQTHWSPWSNGRWLIVSPPWRRYLVYIRFRGAWLCHHFAQYRPAVLITTSAEWWSILYFVCLRFFFYFQLYRVTY